MDRYSHVYKGAPPDHCCCDQALRLLPNGEFGCIFMTGGDHEPRKENYVAMCRSLDRARTWSGPETVLKFDDRGCLLSEVFVHGDTITIMAETHDGFFENWRNFTLTSTDSGATWGELVPFEPAPRRSFIRNLFVTSWGEWLLPLQTYDTVETPEASPLKDGSFKQAYNGALISSDEGETWERSDLIGPLSGWAENNIVELSDGRLVMFVRADGTGVIYRSESTDRGRTWVSLEPTDIPNPGSKFRLHKLSDGRIVLIHNTNPKARNPLSMWISDDDLDTWGYQRVLTDFPGALQYPDGFVDEEEGYVHFAFDYNRHDVICWSAELPD